MSASTRRSKDLSRLRWRQSGSPRATWLQNGFTWQLGFIAGPALGGFVLAAAPFALWSGAALLALLGAAYSLRFDRLLPEQHRRTPATDRLRAGAVEGEAS